MDIVMASVKILRRFWGRIGPYLLVEALLPGGTLIALLLFLYRRRRLGADGQSAGGAFALTPGWWA